MKNKIILFFSFIFLFFKIFGLVVFAEKNYLGIEAVPVEKAFIDIDKDYKYYHELQYLFNKGIIEPEADHKFHPNKLLERDEFVGIAMETSCRRCIIPREEDYLHKYDSKKPFFDVVLKNKYYYCIAEAANLQFTVGYRKGDKCNDGTWKKNEIPFCTKNNIKLEEALAVIMRMGGILTHKQVEKVAKEIETGKRYYPNLAKDIHPKLSDGSAYSFYAYFAKALEFKLIEYDKYGKKKVYRFLEKKDYLEPNKLVTKEEFLIMAYIALKANACPDRVKDYFALKMLIYDKECTFEKQKVGKCDISNKQDPENIFDFRGVAKTSCKKGIDDNKGYLRRFINLENGNIIKKKGIYIDNYKFLEPGKYKVFLKGIDKCGQTSEVRNTIEIKGKRKYNLTVSIIADPIIGYGPLEVDYEGIAWGDCIQGYDWKFGDGAVGKGKYIKHTFIEKGLYKTILTVRDCHGNVADASVLIKVLENRCSNDSDKDGVNDCLDKCPTVSGEKKNSGCPIFIDKDKEYVKDYIALKMLIYDKECTFEKQKAGKCNLSDKQDPKNTFDFRGVARTTCKDGIDDIDGYFRRFVHLKTGRVIRKKGIYIDNYKFLSPGKYKVFLKGVDRCGQTAEVRNTIEIKGKKKYNLTVSIIADPIIGYGPLKVDYEGIAWGDCIQGYDWKFGDGAVGKGKYIDHTFMEKGLYKTILTVRDCHGNVADASVLIRVLEKKLPACVLGLKVDGYTYGNVMCNTCPCDYKIDFKQNVKQCDLLIPAITSIDEKEIFARGNSYYVGELK